MRGAVVDRAAELCCARAPQQFIAIRTLFVVAVIQMCCVLLGCCLWIRIAICISVSKMKSCYKWLEDFRYWQSSVGTYA